MLKLIHMGDTPETPKQFDEYYELLPHNQVLLLLLRHCEPEPTTALYSIQVSAVPLFTNVTYNSQRCQVIVSTCLYECSGIGNLGIPNIQITYR